MEQFLQFVSVNWYFFGVLSALVSTLVYYENRKAGPSVSTQQLTQLVNKDDALLVDMRSAKEFTSGHIVDAINIPFDSFEKRKSELEKYKSRTIILVCKLGQTVTAPAKTLRAEGYQIARLQGGMTEWASSNLPTVKA